MSTDFDRDDFLDKITAIPGWVRTEQDYQKLCKHLHYRLIQMTASKDFLLKHLRQHPEWTDELREEYNELIYAHDHAYNNGPHPELHNSGVEMIVTE